MKIGVFDSGVGGLSVANAIKKALPEHEVMLKEDKANLPYGTKTPGELLTLVTPIFKQMADDGCAAIVVACNTVTTNIIGELRQRVSVPLVGMEPMIKPAASASQTKIIAVFATPATLRSDRYNWLKQTYASDIEVIEPDCSRWAMMIENKTMDRKEIEVNTRLALEAGVDVIVLGCTHYHWIEEIIRDIAKDEAVVIQPQEPVIRQLKSVLEPSA